jgi:ornithine cyclodeaminase/alanine dehydrogenase
MLHVLSAAAKTLGVMGLRLLDVAQGAQFHVALYDGKSGALLALMHADYLGQVRTGAASGVATQYMARPDATEVGLFGTGKQARTQLIAVCKVRKVNRVSVYSPNEEHRRHFAHEMSQVWGRNLPGPSARGSRGQGHRHHRHHEPRARAQRLLARGRRPRQRHRLQLPRQGPSWTSSRSAAPTSSPWTAGTQARLEAGDFVQALEDGSLHWSDVHELGQVIVGRYAGRTRAQDITLFKSLGIGIETCRCRKGLYEGPGSRNTPLIEW